MYVYCEMKKKKKGKEKWKNERKIYVPQLI